MENRLNVEATKPNAKEQKQCNFSECCGERFMGFCNGISKNNEGRYGCEKYKDTYMIHGMIIGLLLGAVIFHVVFGARGVGAGIGAAFGLGVGMCIKKRGGVNTKLKRVLRWSWRVLMCIALIGLIVEIAMNGVSFTAVWVGALFVGVISDEIRYKRTE